MVRFGPALLALAIASLITAIELITSKYPHTAGPPHQEVPIPLRLYVDLRAS
jgi:hypothetical protein